LGELCLAIESVGKGHLPVGWLLAVRGLPVLRLAVLSLRMRWLAVLRLAVVGLCVLLLPVLGLAIRGLAAVGNLPVLCLPVLCLPVLGIGVLRLARLGLPVGLARCVPGRRTLSGATGVGPTWVGRLAWIGDRGRGSHVWRARIGAAQIGAVWLWARCLRGEAEWHVSTLRVLLLRVLPAARRDLARWVSSLRVLSGAIRSRRVLVSRVLWALRVLSRGVLLAAILLGVWRRRVCARRALRVLVSRVPRAWCLLLRVLPRTKRIAPVRRRRPVGIAALRV
jgi:hypothetical protein